MEKPITKKLWEIEQPKPKAGRLKKNILLAVVVISAYVLVQETGISIPGYSLWNQSTDSTLQNAYNNRQSNVQVQGEDGTTYQ